MSAKYSFTSLTSVSQVHHEAAASHPKESL